jgi:N-acetylglucosaminyl-diphospho-decaprenol L-rhamnosyltransferase
MLLSIVMVNWNSTGYLLKCLDSVFHETTGVDFEVIVVDNASTDNGCALILDRFPEVRIVESRSNLGFGGANNVGAGIAQGKYLLFLNPDTLVLGNAIATALGHLDRLKDAGAMGVRLVNPDMTVQTSAILRIPNIQNQLMGIEFLRTRFPRFRIFGTGPLYSKASGPQKVEAISGACMFVKREAFMAAGQFDTRYFMYSEDVDLCKSLQTHGYAVYYADDARVLHFGGTSTSQSKEKNFNVFMMKESTYLLLKKWRGKRYADLYKAVFFVASLARLSALALALPVAWAVRRHTDVARAIVKWEKILEWSAGIFHGPAGNERPENNGTVSC